MLVVLVLLVELVVLVVSASPGRGTKSAAF